MSDDTSLSSLIDLIDTANEGERGFALAVQDNREPGVAELLQDAEQSCRTAATELHEEVLRLGGALEKLDAAKAPVYRGWINFKAVRISRDTKSILEECERGADYARSRYEAAMKVGLPESARTLLERQYQRVVAIQARLRLSRNRYPATEVPRAMDRERTLRHLQADGRGARTGGPR